MKIPIKHSNTKHLALIAGTIALVGGVSVPVAAYAHGGGQGQRSDRGQSRDDRHNWKKDKSAHDSWKNDGFFGWGGLDSLNPDEFANRNTQKLTKLDKFVSDHKLTVENGAALRADVVAKADVVKTELTELSTLKTSISDPASATAEQRASLKAQTLVTFESYYNYKVALSDYKVAVNIAAAAAGVKDRCS